MNACQEVMDLGEFSTNGYGFCCCVHMFSSSFPITRDLHPFGVRLVSGLSSESIKSVEAAS